MYSMYCDVMTNQNDNYFFDKIFFVISEFLGQHNYVA